MDYLDGLIARARELRRRSEATEHRLESLQEEASRLSAEVGSAQPFDPYPTEPAVVPAVSLADWVVVGKGGSRLRDVTRHLLDSSGERTWCGLMAPVRVPAPVARSMSRECAECATAFASSRRA